MADGSQNIDFLYDFLYLDRPRAQSWLAQLVAEGVPVSSKYQKTASDVTNVTASGGIPSVLTAGTSSSGTALEGQELHYSNEWSIPLNLIDMLDDAQFIGRDLATATPGTIVHIRGAAYIMDIRFLQTSWKAVGELMTGNQKITHANKKNIDKQKGEMQVVGGVLSVMPPLPQLFLQTPDEETAWSVLKAEHMLVDTSALSLTYGAAIEGDWHVIAVLDALPDFGLLPPAPPVATALTTSIFTLLDGLRQQMGRPDYAYAINPIAIFRAINRTSSNAE